MRITVGQRTLLAKTCAMCGCFKMAEAFKMVSNGRYRDSYCSSCHNSYTHPKIRYRQNKSQILASRSRQIWSKEDLQRLQDLMQEGYTVLQMALILKRSVYAVYTKKNKLNQEP